MSKPADTTANKLSETEREVLKAFLRLSSPQSDASAIEQKLLTSLAFAYRRMKVAN